MPENTGVYAITAVSRRLFGEGSKGPVAGRRVRRHGSSFCPSGFMRLLGSVEVVLGTRDFGYPSLLLLSGLNYGPEHITAGQPNHSDNCLRSSRMRALYCRSRPTIVLERVNYDQISDKYLRLYRILDYGGTRSCKPKPPQPALFTLLYTD